jgi:phytoene/squalene synthetase
MTMCFEPSNVDPLQIAQMQQSQDLAARITKAKSKQSYTIARFLVDRDLVPEAYQAYAYFRWLDDCLDLEFDDRSERLAFVYRQRSLMNRCYQGDWPTDTTTEENMLLNLISNDSMENLGLQSYIRNMMDVMSFDAERRGSLISQEELAGYTRSLATAVTDALHYFIGQDCFSPQVKDRHIAATGAHIAHMLRDTLDDVQGGYFNIPREYLEKNHIDPRDVTSGPYRAWIKARVKLARTCFDNGREYLSQVQNLRCRIAGYTYIGRFEPVLNAIEREDYYLREAYPECKSLRVALKLCLAALLQAHTRRREMTPPQLYSIEDN